MQLAIEEQVKTLCWYHATQPAITPMAPAPPGAVPCACMPPFFIFLYTSYATIVWSNRVVGLSVPGSKSRYGPGARAGGKKSTCWWIFLVPGRTEAVQAASRHVASLVLSSLTVSCGWAVHQRSKKVSIVGEGLTSRPGFVASGFRMM